MQACFTPLLTTPPKPMVSPITSVAMLAATDKEVNWIGLYEGILRFQLRGKSLQLKLRNRVQTFSTEFRIFSLPLGSAWHFYHHTLDISSFTAVIKTGTLLQKTVNWMLYTICVSMLGWIVTNRRNTKTLQCQKRLKGCAAPCGIPFYVTAIISITISLGWLLPQLCKDIKTCHTSQAQSSKRFIPAFG